MRIGRKSIVNQIESRANEVARQIDVLCVKNEGKNWTDEEITAFDLYLGEWCGLEYAYKTLTM